MKYVFRPRKYSDKRDKVRKVMLIACLIMFLGCIGVIAKIQIIDPYFQSNVNKRIQDIYHESESNRSLTKKSARAENLKKIVSINADIVGWMRVNNTVIDYPVMQAFASDKSYYLSHDYNHNATRYGSIFIDAACAKREKTRNILVHGHSMRDGTMFAPLIKFTELDMYKKSPTIFFDTVECEADFKIIGAFKTNTLESQGKPFNYLQCEFANDSEFLNFVHQVKIRSMLKIPVNVNEKDQLLTLSTCSYEMDEFRTVVVARKIREGELRAIDIDNAVVNPKPLMPKGYYRAYGGTAPVVKTFEQAMEDGDIDWYGFD